MAKPHTHKRTEVYKHQGHRFTVHVLGYREIPDLLMDNCFAAWVRKHGRMKPRGGMELTFETIYGLK